MQQSSTQFSCNRFSRRPADKLEPAIEYLKNQLLINPIFPRLVAAKTILVSILWDFKSDRRYKALTLNLAERATKVLDQLSRLFEQTPGLTQNTEQLQQILEDIDLFVHSTTQSDDSYQRLFVEDICDQYISLEHKLTSLLNNCEPRHIKPLSEDLENSGALSSGILNHACGVTVKGGQFYNIYGNFSNGQPNLGQIPKAIIQTLRVVPAEWYKK